MKMEQNDSEINPTNLAADKKRLVDVVQTAFKDMLAKLPCVGKEKEK